MSDTNDETQRALMTRVQADLGDDIVAVLRDFAKQIGALQSLQTQVTLLDKKLEAHLDSHREAGQK